MAAGKRIKHAGVKRQYNTKRAVRMKNRHHVAAAAAAEMSKLNAGEKRVASKRHGHFWRRYIFAIHQQSGRKSDEGGGIKHGGANDIMAANVSGHLAAKRSAAYHQAAVRNKRRRRGVASGSVAICGVNINAGDNGSSVANISMALA